MRFLPVSLLGALPLCAIFPLLQGCAGDVSPTSTLAPIREYDTPYSIALLDDIVIEKGDHPPMILHVTEGEPVEYPEGETLQVIGKTPDDVTSVLKKRDPDITAVKFKEYHGSRITVTGEVNIQTNFSLQDTPMRALDAIASAGGFTPLADNSGVILTRQNAGWVQVYKLDLHAVQEGRAAYYNILLEPGDRIYVPKNFL